MWARGSRATQPGNLHAPAQASTALKRRVKGPSFHNRSNHRNQEGRACVNSKCPIVRSATDAQNGFGIENLP